MSVQMHTMPLRCCRQYGATSASVSAEQTEQSGPQSIKTKVRRLVTCAMHIGAMRFAVGSLSRVRTQKKLKKESS